MNNYAHTEISLDHFIVPSRDRIASARLLAELLGVRWAETGAVGPFSPVYVSDSLTLDFDESTEPFPVGHYAFRVDDQHFDAIVQRLTVAKIPYRSTPHGAVDQNARQAPSFRSGKDSASSEAVVNVNQESFAIGARC